MVGTEDGFSNARRRIDPEDDALFSEPPSLFLDEEYLDEDDYLDDGYGDRDYAESDLEEHNNHEFLLEGELLPDHGLFSYDEPSSLPDPVADSSSHLLLDEHPPGELAPSWTDERPAAPPVVLDQPIGVDHQWSGAQTVNYVPHEVADYDYDDEDTGEASDRDFRKSRRLSRFLMVLTVLVLGGVTSAVYVYLNREPAATPTASDDGTAAESTEGTVEGSPGGSTTPLSGTDPVAIITNSGTVRIATSTETDAAAIELGSAQGIGEANYVGLTNDVAFIVDANGDAWRSTYRTDPTPVKLVELGAPGATTTYEFLGNDDGTIFFTDSEGTLWSVDAANSATSIYSPESPEAAIEQLASNQTTLYILTTAGDVYRREHAGGETVLAYGPTNDNPKTISLAPTQSGVILTAGGGIVRIVDPLKDPPIEALYKPRGDKAVSAIGVGDGGLIVTESGNVVYSVLGADDVATYTADAAAGKPSATQAIALGNGTAGAVDADGNVWSLDLAADNPTKVWDAAAQGKATMVRPNTDAFSVLDAQGNAWTVPAVAGTPVQISSTADARSVSTSLFALDTTG